MQKAREYLSEQNSLLEVYLNEELNLYKVSEIAKLISETKDKRFENYVKIEDILGKESKAKFETLRNYFIGNDWIKDCIEEENIIESMEIIEKEWSSMQDLQESLSVIYDKIDKLEDYLWEYIVAIINNFEKWEIDINEELKEKINKYIEGVKEQETNEKIEKNVWSSNEKLRSIVENPEKKAEFKKINNELIAKLNTNLRNTYWTYIKIFESKKENEINGYINKLQEIYREVIEFLQENSDNKYKNILNNNHIVWFFDGQILEIKQIKNSSLNINEKRSSLINNYKLFVEMVYKFEEVFYNEFKLETESEYDDKINEWNKEEIARLIKNNKLSIWYVATKLGIERDKILVWLISEIDQDKKMNFNIETLKVSEKDKNIEKRTENDEKKEKEAIVFKELNKETLNKLNSKIENAYVLYKNILSSSNSRIVKSQILSLKKAFHNIEKSKEIGDNIKKKLNYIKKDIDKLANIKWNWVVSKEKIFETYINFKEILEK